MKRIFPLTLWSLSALPLSFAPDALAQNHAQSIITLNEDTQVQHSWALDVAMSPALITHRSQIVDTTHYAPTPTDWQAFLADVSAGLLARINAARGSTGLRPLLSDSTLVNSAEGHSRDMLTRNYFSHVSPEGLSHGDRLPYRARDSYILVGENIWTATGADWRADQLAQTAFSDWMNSPGHRENILRPEYHLGGIGLAADSQTLQVTMLYAATKDQAARDAASQDSVDTSGVAAATAQAIQSALAHAGIYVEEDIRLSAIAHAFAERMRKEQFFATTAPDGQSLVELALKSLPGRSGSAKAAVSNVVMAVQAGNSAIAGKIMQSWGNQFSGMAGFERFGIGVSGSSGSYYAAAVLARSN